ncbi:MAG: hypothetical protein WCJ52_10740 [Phenylobacterium sp.]|uniref:hypothetical protein n=1 Tax=Phenylobacterium sp. TaxID=1871053 RepID=UPI003016A465
MSALDAVLIALNVAVPLVALVAGKTPERIAALIFILATGATILAGNLWKYKEIGTLLLTIDGLMALSFLVLAVRYNYLWIALMMGAMSGYFSIHAYYLAMAIPLDTMFAMASNIATGVVLISLSIGVWSSRSRPAEP